jgi:hypothetical protein
MRISSFSPLLVMLLFFLGLGLLLISKNQFKHLLILSLFIPYLFLAGTSAMGSHLVFADSFMALLAAFSIVRISEKFKNENYAKIFLYAIVIIILVTSAIKFNELVPHPLAKNELGKLIDFKEKEIGKNSLVVVDSRIYRGQTVFMFWDRHYLEASYLQQLLGMMDNLTGTYAPINTYFVQCISTDCGWGTIQNQPEFNKSMEDIVAFFENSSKLEKVIYDASGKPYFNIYKATFSLKPSVLEMADSTHEWFYYPVAYKPAERVFDNYKAYGLGSLLDKFAHLILYLEVMTAVLLSAYLLYLFYSGAKQ